MIEKLESINRWFRRIGEQILKFRWLFIAILIVVDVIGFWGMTKVKTDKTWDSWFSKDDPINIATDKFEDVFGNNDYVGLLIEAPDVFDPEILSMIRELGHDLLNGVPLATELTSLSDFEYSLGTDDGIIIDNLIPNPIPTDPKEIERIRKLAFSKKNLINRLFTEDSKQTWLIMRLREYPDGFEEKYGEEGAVVVGREVEKIIHSEKYDKYNIKHTGMPMVGYNKLLFFNTEAARVIGLALLVVLAVLVITLRTVRGVVVPLITAFSAIIVTYGSMGHLGISIDNSLITIPIYLGLAVSIGYSIHIFNFFKRQFSETGNRTDSVLYAIEHTGWPLFFTGLTTIGSLLSFNLTKIVSIQWVGNASASIISVVFMFVIIMTPALLSIGKDKPKSKGSLAPKPNGSDKFFHALSEFVLNHKLSISAMFILTIAILGYGATKTRVDFDTFKSFGLKVPYVKEVNDVGNSPIGSLYSYDVVVEFPEEGMAKLPENLKRLEKFESKIKELALTKRTTSILDIIKDMNRTLNSDSEADYRIPNNDEMAAQLLLMYEMSGGNETEKWMDYEYKRLRLMVEINKFQSSEVEHEVAYIKTLAHELFPEAEIMMVGTLIQGAIINNYIARGQVTSFIFALFVIGILMMIVFRSIKSGLIGLIPNMTPVFVIGGIMGFMDIGMDMMTMTIIPLIMGIAVDDTIHFINHCKYEVEVSGSYEAAISRTFKTVGKALLMTTVILVSTFSMYTTSVTNVFVNWGILIGAGLLSALIADYTMTPILLQHFKPFGPEKPQANERA